VLHTIGRVVVEADQPASEDEEGVLIFQKAGADITLTLLHHGSGPGAGGGGGEEGGGRGGGGVGSNSNASSTDPSGSGGGVGLVLKAARLEMSGNAMAATEANAQSLEARQWMVQLYEFALLMHPLQEWAFPPVHRQLTALVATRAWRASTAATAAGPRGGSAATAESDSNNNKGSEAVEAGDLVVAIRSAGWWRGTVYPSTSASAAATAGMVRGRSSSAQVAIPADALGGDFRPVLQLHPAYHGFPVRACAKQARK
jgi:hypothetical protein